MKKNRTMRAAALLLALTLMTSCFVGGTFAKYTSSATGKDSARVAYWGFGETTSLALSGLFNNAYSTDVQSKNAEDVIAPGTAGSASFGFVYDEEVKSNLTGVETAIAVTGPEVDYTFTVAVTESCDALIKANTNIQWKLTKKVGTDPATDVIAWGTWDAMITAIKDLAGTGHTNGVKDYEANTLPAAFTAADEMYTIEWQWLIEGMETYDHDNNAGTDKISQDAYDTYMANQGVLDDCSITITISAEQKNS